MSFGRAIATAGASNVRWLSTTDGSFHAVKASARFTHPNPSRYHETKRSPRLTTGRELGAHRIQRSGPIRGDPSSHHQADSAHGTFRKKSRKLGQTPCHHQARERAGESNTNRRGRRARFHFALGHAGSPAATRITGSREKAQQRGH